MHRIFYFITTLSLFSELVSSHSSSPNRIHESTKEWGQLERLEETERGLTGLGFSVASSYDGKIIACGSPYKNDNRGEVTVYKYNTEKSKWTKRGFEIPGNDHNQFFGHDVALSRDGELLVVSAPKAKNEMGQVSVFVYDAEDNDWFPIGGLMRGTLQGEKHGSSIAVDEKGQFIAVGSPGRPTQVEKAGTVRVYEYNSEVDEWVQLGPEILGQDYNDEFGYSVDILTHEGDIYVGVGAPDEEDTRGTASVYKFNPDQQEWKLVGNRFVDGDVRSTELGRSVSLGHDGTYLLLAVGFPGPGIDATSKIKSGVEVYRINEEGEWWYYGQLIYPFEQNDGTGYKVSLSKDGQTLAISSPDYDGGTGMVSVYEYHKDKGEEDRGLYEQIGSAIIGEKNSEFGFSLALSRDGTTVTAGSPDKLYVNSFIQPHEHKVCTLSFLNFYLSSRCCFLILTRFEFVLVTI